MIEADAVGDLEVVRRIQGNPLVSLRERNRAQHFQVSSRRLKPFHPRLVDEVHEGRGAAVHDRHFRAVQFDNRVVDAESGQRGEQVLDGLDRNRFARQTGLILDSSQVGHHRGDFQTAEIGALKADAGISRRRLQRQGYFVAGMKTDSGAGDGSTKGTLGAHDLSVDRWEGRPDLSKPPATPKAQPSAAVSD
jgi:hypothetical protein